MNWLSRPVAASRHCRLSGAPSKRDNRAMAPEARPANGMLPPTLPFGEFRLRSLRLGDEIAWHKYLADPSVIEHTSFPVLDIDAVRAMVARHIGEYAAKASCRWALADPNDDLIGTCGFYRWSLASAHVDLVYDLAAAHWGKGIMRHAVTAAVEWAFATAHFHRVQAYVITSNQRSIALLERCGFAREGMLRHFRIARGEPRDCYLYARISALPLRAVTLES